jgi:hypothetical protein
VRSTTKTDAHWVSRSLSRYGQASRAEKNRKRHADHLFTPETSSISGAPTGEPTPLSLRGCGRSSQPESNDLPHQPPDARHFRGLTPAHLYPFLQRTRKSNQTSQVFPDMPLPTLSAVGSSPSPSLATPELQVAIPPSPQFRSAEAASDSSLHLRLPSSVGTV